MEKTNLPKTRTLADIIRYDGIKAKGFGTIPKFIMHDMELSLESKAIYGYFCSLCGNGETTFPSRDTILCSLNLSKNGYYGHYNALIEQGYIKVERANPSDFKSHNIYTIISNPKKVAEYAKKNKDKKDIYGSIDSYGYGILPRAIMIDDRLNIKAKGIYCYFASYAGAGDTAFPKKDNILYHLNISENTYYRYYNKLIQYNYIIPVQRRNNGDFGVCDYILNQMPDEQIGTALQKSRRDRIKSPISKKEDTVKVTVKSAKTIKDNTSAISKKGDIVKGDIKKGDIVNEDNIINSVPINKFSTNSGIYQSNPEATSSNNNSTETASPIDLIDTNKIPEIVSKNISLSQLKDKYKDNLDELNIINNILIEILSERKSFFRISGKDVPVDTVKPIFESIEKKHVEYVIRSLVNNDNKFKIKGSVENYLRTCLFNAPRTISYYFDRSFSKQEEKSDNEDFFTKIVQQSMKFGKYSQPQNKEEPSFDNLA